MQADNSEAVQQPTENSEPVPNVASSEKGATAEVFDWSQGNDPLAYWERMAEKELSPSKDIQPHAEIILTSSLPGESHVNDTKGLEADKEQDEEVNFDLLGEDSDQEPEVQGRGDARFPGRRSVQEQETQLSFEALFGDEEVVEYDDGEAENLPLTGEGTTVVGNARPRPEALELDWLSPEFGDSDAPNTEHLQHPVDVQFTDAKIPALYSALHRNHADKVYLVRLPSALRVEEQVYAPQRLADELQRHSSELLSASNVLRWRCQRGPSGPLGSGSSGSGVEVESNARIVEWDNGDMHLVIGNEVFDISKHNLAMDHVYLFARPPPTTPTGALSEGTQLSKEDNVHVCQHKFTTALHLRPCPFRKGISAQITNKQIQSRFQRKYLERELKMTLTSEPPRAPAAAAEAQRTRTDLTQLKRRRDAILQRAQPTSSSSSSSSSKSGSLFPPGGGESEYAFDGEDESTTLGTAGVTAEANSSGSLRLHSIMKSGGEPPTRYGCFKCISRMHVCCV